MIKKMSKEEVIELIKKNSIEVWYDDKWNYWNTGDDYRTCPLLHLVHNIERKGSHIIIIRDIQKIQKSNPITKADIFGQEGEYPNKDKE